MRFTATLSYKYASDEASQENCEVYSICHFVSQMILYLGPLLQCMVNFPKMVNFDGKFAKYVFYHGKYTYLLIL
jgi:hypothetical protein